MNSLDAPCDYDRILAEERPMAASIAKFMRHFLKPNCVFDFGCGPGLYVEEMWKQGVPAIGFDIDPRVAQYPNCVVWDLTDAGALVEPRTPVDCVLCLEVAEHIEEQAALSLVDRCVEHGRIIIWSAAQPGQGGEGHINCQHPDYWMREFAMRGVSQNYIIRERLLHAVKQDTYMGWFINNLLVFSRD